LTDRNRSFGRSIAAWLIGLVAVSLEVAAAPPAGATDPQVVRTTPREGPRDIRHDYFVEVLRLTLTATEAEHGPVELREVDLDINQARIVEELARGRFIDVTWVASTDKRERILRPVRFPLLKGWLGVRMMIIDAETEPMFAAIRTLEELRPLVAVQGIGWPDTDILRANGLRVRGHGAYQEMFDMVARGEVDYFPRGAQEIFGELEAHPHLPALKAAREPVLRYRNPIYFFVARNNRALAARLALGLDRIKADGSFDALFRSHPLTRSLRPGLIAGRRIFDLTNPFLTDRN